MPDFFFILGGLAAIAAGSVCIYAVTPHQRLWARPWPGRPALAASMALFVLAFWSLGQAMRHLTVVFVFFTALMLALVVLPYIGALLHVRRNT